MRFKRPQGGDKRTKERFLIIPLTIDFETRWFEKAKWEEEYIESFSCYRPGITVNSGPAFWKHIKWIDEED